MHIKRILKDLKDIRKCKEFIKRKFREKCMGWWMVRRAYFDDGTPLGSSAK